MQRHTRLTHVVSNYKIPDIFLLMHAHFNSIFRSKLAPFLRWCQLILTGFPKISIDEHDCVSNHQRFDCLLNRLFRPRSNKTSKLRVAGLCVGNSPETGAFPAQMASNAVNVSIWWCHRAVASRYKHTTARKTFPLQPAHWMLEWGRYSLCSNKN